MCGDPRTARLDAMDGTGTRGSPTGARVQGTLREMWETRPTRPREGRKVAGVAAAVGRRYDVDPVLVRVGFVVAAFGGIGFWLYVLGALALPGERKDGTTGRDLRPHALIGLAVIGFFALTGVFRGDDGPGWGGGSILAALLALGLLVLLHRSRGALPVAPPAARTRPPTLPMPPCPSSRARRRGTRSARRRSPGTCPSPPPHRRPRRRAARPSRP
jgi:phage shock protein PspC (stress-responsive transcriptional regulator)